MKKTIILILLTLSFLEANTLNWLNYKEVYELSSDKLINKPVFVFVSRDNCRFCEKEKERIINNNIFKTFLEENYIPVHVNQDQDFIPVDLLSEMVPAFYILSPRTLRPIISKPAYGAIPLDQLRKWLELFLTAYNKDNK